MQRERDREREKKGLCKILSNNFAIWCLNKSLQRQDGVFLRFLSAPAEINGEFCSGPTLFHLSQSGSTFPSNSLPIWFQPMLALGEMCQAFGSQK